MRRLHCSTCTCADTWDRGRVDLAAPFYALVLAVDRLTLAEQIAAQRRTRDRHLTERGDT